MTPVGNERAFVVQFSETSRWNPSSFIKSIWEWPPESINTFGSVSDPVREPYVGVSSCGPPMITIRFDGSIERRDKDPSSIKGRLFLAKSRDLVYSKIDIRNGAIGVVPESFAQVCVTSEYPILRVRQDFADVRYLRLLVRSSGMRHEIHSRISGATGRKRIQPSDFLMIKAPFPSIDTQIAIVAHAEEAENALKAVRVKSARTIREADAAFLDALGLQAPEPSDLPKVMSLRWSDVERWGVAYNQRVASGLDLRAGRYPVKTLDDVLESTQYGTSEKANTEGRGVLVLRICNVKDGRLDLRSRKHVEIRSKTVQNLTLVDGDVLMIRTSGSRSLVGTTAVVAGVPNPTVAASYLIRLRFSLDVVEPAFVVAVLNGPLGRCQVEAVARQIMQNNINSQEIRGLLVPVPPLDVQLDLVGRLTQAKRRAATLLAAAVEKHREAMVEVDEMILGTRSPPK